MRALAHPLRLRILDELSINGPLTASGLGERLAESSGATSYHLRQLEKHGLVREVTAKGNARERWWERRPGSISTPEPARVPAGQRGATRHPADRERVEPRRARRISTSSWTRATNVFGQEWFDALDRRHDQPAPHPRAAAPARGRPRRRALEVHRRLQDHPDRGFAAGADPPQRVPPGARRRDRRRAGKDLRECRWSREEFLMREGVIMTTGTITTYAGSDRIGGIAGLAVRAGHALEDWGRRIARARRRASSSRSASRSSVRPVRPSSRAATRTPARTSCCASRARVHDRRSR